MRRTLRLTFIAFMLTTGCNSLFGIHEGTPRPMCVDDMMIDDLEDADELICRRFAGRTGFWYVFGDGSPTGELTPSSNKTFTPMRIEDGSRGTSRYAARFSGSGFTRFGAIMGFDLLSPRQTFAVGGLGGITFWMKSSTPVAIDFPTEETVPTGEGGQCENGCNDHFSFQITAPAPGWLKYDVPFNALRGGGGSATWNPRHLYGVNFRVPPGAPFDLWVDDVAFYACAGPECEPTCTDPRFPVPCRALGGPRSSCQPPGTVCAAVETWCADPLLIDDMEDGDPAICGSGGRQGRWYAIGDRTSTDLMPSEGMDFFPTAIPGGRGTSHHAARLSGSGFTEWGAAMGFGLNGSQAYDASQRSGLRFWMKSNVPVIVGLPTVEAALPSQGGQCADEQGQHNCGNSFSFKITAPSSDWVEYEVPFTAFSQAGGSAPWNPSHLLNVNFTPRPNTTFDVWVDDVQFYDCTAPGCTPTCADPAFPASCPANGGTPAGCRPPGTVCADFVPGCNASNTTVAPADGLIAAFMGTGGTDIPGVVLAWGTPTPTYATDGQLHITLDAPATPTTQALFVADRFQDCIDAANFAGVQFRISGSFSGCTLAYFTEDSVHLFDDGDPVYGSHGVGFPGARPPSKTFASGQITSVPQTVMMPFTGLAHGDPETPLDIAKVTGLGWAFFVDASTSAGTPSCVADLTIDDVRFY